MANVHRWNGRATSQVPSVPDYLPTLGRGRHRRGAGRVCLMEYVSMLAGERHSDHPHCTHPALAGLARLVNDRTSTEAARCRLAPLAPDLIGTRTGDPRMVPAIALAALRAAARTGGPNIDTVRRRLARTQQRLARMNRSRADRVRARIYQDLCEPPADTFCCYSSIRSALALGWANVEALPAPARDEWLHALLRDAIEEAHHVLLVSDTLPAAAASGPPARHGATTTTEMHSERRTVLGRLSLHKRR